MRLKSEFIQLPVSFDVQRLAEEVLQFRDNDWDAHDQDYGGNSTLVLISPNGERNSDHSGPMRPTAALNRCPYLKQVIASFNTVVGRSSLIRLDPGSEVAAHYDRNYSSRQRVRVHIPIVTDPGVIFSSVGNIDVTMRTGEAWVFDNWRAHAVMNNSDVAVIHLVFDTTGTSTFWSMVERGQDPRSRAEGWEETRTAVPYQPDSSPEILCERYNRTTVSSPAEVDNMLCEFLADIQTLRSDKPESYENLESAMQRFRQDWRSRWLLHSDTLDGLPHYKILLRDLSTHGKRLLGDTVLTSNSALAVDVLDRWLASTMDTNAIRQRSLPERVPTTTLDTSLFDSPVFVVAAPRSGSTMLFELLQENREFWTIGDESHRLFESIRQLNPATREYESNALGAEDLTDKIGMALFGAFKKRLRNSRGKLLSDIPAETQASSLRVLEKTPKNALRIPFIRKLFPDAKFVYLHRQARPNIGSIIDAWMSGNFVTYPNLPDWRGRPWSLLLPRGWRELRGRPLAEIAAWQWTVTNQKIVDDLSVLPDGSWHSVAYEDLVNNREVTLRKLCEFADVPFGPRMQSLSKGQLPHSKYTLEPPATDKWKRHQSEIEAALSVRKEFQNVVDSIARLG